ncbi:hypothetical protein [Dyadobacter sp. BHUBP1]|uniref:hypothetical protein n=1 Tax=Dyadobacter sp. BHUBP1 TaxID=3424178 RepID=UPI003D32DC3B
MLPKHILAQIACLAQRIEKLEKAVQSGKLCCVESVTGSAVDNTDPKNPVINLTDVVSSGMDYLWAIPTVDPDTQEIIPNWSQGHIAPQGYLFKPDPQIPGDIWPNKNYKYLLGDTSMYGVDFKAYIDEWDNSTNPVKGYVMVTSVPDPTRYVISKILTDNVDDAGFTKVDYEYVSHNGISAFGFADEEPVKVHFFMVGDAGN